MQFIGEICALSTAVVWSCSSLAFGAATVRVGAVPVNMLRLAAAAVFVSVFILVAQPSLALNGKQILFLALSGIVGLAVGDWFLFRAYHEIGPRITMLIMSMAPAIAAILAYFTIGETISPLGILGIGVTLSGVGMVVFAGGRAKGKVALSVTGILAAVVASAGQGGGLLLAKMAFQEGEINGFVATFFRLLASLVVLSPVMIIRARSDRKVFARDRRALGLTILGAFLGPFVGIALSLTAVAHTSVGVAATLIATVPIVMLPLSALLGREPPTSRSVWGAVTAVAGVGLLFLRSLH
jgi:drug/metabolite transporter (DMT)-like permease